MESPDWLKRLEALGQRAPAAPRERWCVGGVACGSIEPALASRMVAAGLPLRREGDGWAVDDDAALAAIAAWMHAQGVGGRWRDELIPVIDAAGRIHARVERAAVRPLGVATQAVHLVGTTADGRVWVQQRALDKATDPGQWDTLMGGLVCEEESVEETLERELWEEAGLRLEQLRDPAPIGRITVQRPLPEGYMVEHIHMFEAMVPDGVEPVNQDGEVERFECIGVPQLVERLREPRFTLEAALIHGEWLRRHGFV